MHFSKTYPRLLENLPLELQENAIQYRQLKQIIKQIVNELSSLGLEPPLLYKLLGNKNDPLIAAPLRSRPVLSTCISPSASGRVPGSNVTSMVSGYGFPKIVYECCEDSKIETKLRVYVDFAENTDDILRHGTKMLDVVRQNETDTSLRDYDNLEATASNGNAELDPCAASETGIVWISQKADSEHTTIQGSDGSSVGASLPQTPLRAEVHEVVIPLVSNTEFFKLLYTTLEHMSFQLKSVEDNFMETLKTLSRTIGDSAHPVSSSHSVLRGSFHAVSPLKDNGGAINVRRGDLSKSDLYSWREIFQLYVEAEVFESMRERDRGELSIEECERRLQLFTDQLTQRDLATQGKLKLKGSRRALETFLQLNVLILNVKKFQLANSEATRKILKKHTKQTSLPSPSDAFCHSLPQPVLLPQARSFSLPHIFVQAIGETLLPIIPHLDDYSCLICTNIAFKPIRLDCGHLFCVRCLVKMQKRGKDNCPMCRAPSVLIANRSNVDWALMNFMQDWFPLEAKGKSKANEKEANAEELAELGLDPDAMCAIM